MFTTMRRKSMSSSNMWVNSHQRRLLHFITLAILCCALVPNTRGLSTIDEREDRKLFGGYRITPKFCRPSKTLPKADPRSRGPTICMFNHECAQRNGEVVGACMDGFLFGACCQIPGEEVHNTLIQQAQYASQITPNQAAALSYENYVNQQQLNQNDDLLSLPQLQYSGNTQEGIEATSPTEMNDNTGTGEVYETGSDFENDASQSSNYASSNNVDENYKYTPQSPTIVQYAAGSSGLYPTSTASPLPQVNQFTSDVESQTLSSNSGYYSTGYDDNMINTAPMFVTAVPSVEEDGYSVGAQSEELTGDSGTDFEDLQFSTGYGPSTVIVPSSQKNQSSFSSSVDSDVISFSTTEKIIYNKPVFKPKPTEQTKPQPGLNNGAHNNYVLVQTITNEKVPSKKPYEGITTTNMDSIESIILMLNETNHGPSYDVDNSGQPGVEPVSYGTQSYGTQRPYLSTSALSSNKVNGNTGQYVSSTTRPQNTGLSTHRPVTSPQPSYSTQFINTQSGSFHSPSYASTGYVSSTQTPLNNKISSTTARPTVLYTRPSSRPTSVVTHYSSQKPEPFEGNNVAATVTRRPPPNRRTSTKSTTKSPTKPLKISRPTNSASSTATRVTANTKKPPSTSYVTGPTTPRPRPSTTPSYPGYSTISTVSDKVDYNVYSSTPSAISSSSYGDNSAYTGSTQNNLLGNFPPTKIPPSPTVIITPKPTVNLNTPTSWTNRPSVGTQTSTPGTKITGMPSASYLYNSAVTQRPDYFSSTPQSYIKVPTVVSNEFDDPGYFGDVASNKPPPNYSYGTTSNFFASSRPTDDRPAFPGYYGPTPSYSTFNVPLASEGNDFEEETHTSSNDFVNFPPVRNPNLNMSATSSSVTTDLELSTPAFVEDDVLKDKMNILVDKIVQSLQQNFNALADMVEDRNVSSSNFAAQQSVTRKPTAAQSTSKRPQPTRAQIATSKPPTSPTKIPNKNATRTPTKPTKTTSLKPGISNATRKPTVATKKPTQPTKKVSNKPVTATATRKPSTSATSAAGGKKPTKPTRKNPSSTTTTEANLSEFSADNGNSDGTLTEETSDIETGTETSRRIQCGVRPHIKSGRIVGGKGATFGEWPWQVLVRESTWLGLFTKNKCGGVLITNRFVITAAHCQPGFLASLVAVFGEFDISGDLESKRSVTKNVRRVIVHRQYDAATFENDLALLELDSPIHYDSHIVPICMPADEAEFTGRMATVTGWGRLKYGGGVPSILQEVQVPIIENSVCQEMFHTAGHNKKILPSFLCAGYANGQKDSCEGDSGGPLVLQRDDGRWELAGTVSHGIKCAAPYLPGVYMRTTYYKPWLKSITGVK